METNSLIWYPAVGDDSVGRGYYGDGHIEPWRFPGSPGGPEMAVPITIPSAQVQLRVTFENGRVNWDDFRATLRTELGCLCARQWKYKMAMFEQENT